MTARRIFDALVDRVLGGPAVTAPEVRAAVADGGDGAPIPAELAELLDKVRRHAYKVTDADIARVKAVGVDEETIFELTIAAAIGVSRRRLEAAMRVIDAAG